MNEELLPLCLSSFISVLVYKRKENKEIEA